jgi:hypothetical protein
MNREIYSKWFVKLICCFIPKRRRRRRRRRRIERDLEKNIRENNINNFLKRSFIKINSYFFG